jgi:hypothetical protein
VRGEKNSSGNRGEKRKKEIWEKNKEKSKRKRRK